MASSENKIFIPSNKRHTVKKCPICSSSQVEMINEDGFEFLRCLKCGYDESADYDEAYPEQRGGGKGKGGSPYKRGGALRTQKR